MKTDPLSCFKQNLLIIAIFFINLMTANSVISQEIEVPSSFNPVGSGARAIGMGGAFIGIADDATAASWNPGGLIQMHKAQASFVLSHFHRNEDIEFGIHPESSGDHNVSEYHVNYFSLTLPFEWMERNMIVSLSYQQLYDFYREWNFNKHDENSLLISDRNYSYIQDGLLSAIGLSYCIQVSPTFSLGVTYNIWKDDLTPNSWSQRYKMNGTVTFPLFDETEAEQSDVVEDFSFSGVNANIGFLWEITNQLSLGGVFKTPFNGDLDHKESRTFISPSNPHNEKFESEDSLKLPLSYGLGVVYRFSPIFAISADIYRTNWNDYKHTLESGLVKSPVSGLAINESQVDPTYQVRLGTEYRIINESLKNIIFIRGGVFYDPAPAEKSPDDIFGVSLGTGISTEQFALDAAYQYRTGNNIGESMMSHLHYSQDMDEHKAYLSMIVYF
jgi:long-subunit fatty acid transport protein